MRVRSLDIMERVVVAAREIQGSHADGGAASERAPWISRVGFRSSWERSLDLTRRDQMPVDEILGCYDQRIMPRTRWPHPDALRFGHLLKDLRLQRGWSLQQLARASGMTATYLGFLERGLNLPSITAVINLAEVLGVDAGDFIRHVAAGRKKSPPAMLPPLPEDS